MSDREALLTEIRQSPEDWYFRLMLADYLYENGEPELSQYIHRCHHMLCEQQNKDKWLDILNSDKILNISDGKWVKKIYSDFKAVDVLGVYKYANGLSNDWLCCGVLMNGHWFTLSCANVWLSNGQWLPSTLAYVSLFDTKDECLIDGFTHYQLKILERRK